MALTDKLTAIANAIRAKTGSSATLTLTEMAAAIQGISGFDSDATYNQQNAVVSDYLSEVTYTSDYTTSSVDTYNSISTDYSKDKPVGYSLGSSKNYVVYDVNAKRAFAETGAAIKNITPTTSGYFFTKDNSGNLIQAGRLLPTGALRMIALSSCDNVRDLGGWTCDGGTVKYGKIFRGSKFVGRNGVTVSEADKNIIKNFLGVRTEIDFQLSGEGGAQSGSGLGVGVEYIPLPTNASYVEMVNLSGSTTEIKTALLKVFDNVHNDLPLYFHCFYGADRTGTLACIIEALLGVSQSDIDKDYELTTFSGTARARNLNSITGSQSTYKDLITYFYTFGKSNLRDNVVKWALRLGISLATINSFREAMINGTPQTLSADTVTVTNNLTNASTNNLATDTTEYDSYTATITAASGYTLNGATVSITMGGTDITSSAYSNGVISISQVTGALVISVSAVSSARLPVEYQEVEYIENSTTAWIDTGITSKYGIRTKVGASLTAYNSYQGVIAAYGSVRDNVGFSGRKAWWAAPNAATAGKAVTLAENRKYDIDCLRTDSGYLTYTHSGGVNSAGTNTYSDYTNTVTYGLFARNKGTSQDYSFIGKIYYCEIYDNGTLVANMIPCYRKSDNAIGMYDLTRNAFYSSENSEVFTKGSDV